MNYSVEIWPIKDGTCTRLQQVFFGTLKAAREFAKHVSIEERVLGEVYRGRYLLGQYENGSYLKV